MIKVAFFLHAFPVQSETFVSLELLGLQNAGVTGEIYTEKMHTQEIQHPHIQKIKFIKNTFPEKIFSTRVVFLLALAHFFWLLKAPRRYVKSIHILFQMFSLEHLRVFFKSALIAKKIYRSKFNLIYIHESDSPSLYGLVCGQLCQIPVGIIFHTYYLFYKNSFLKQKIDFADFIIFQSKYSKNIALKLSQSRNHKRKMHVIYSPGINTSFFQSNKNKQFSSKEIKLVSLGRLEEAKGFEFLIKAVSILKENGHKVKFKIIGQGSLNNYFRLLIKYFKLQKEIQLLGFLPHDKKLISTLSSSDIFVLPSVIDQTGVRDVHPNAIKEAMSMGLLVLTSKLGGIEEVVKNGENGYLIKKVSPQTLSEEIQKIFMLDSSKKRAIALQAHATIQKDHDSYHIAQQLSQIFFSYVRSK